MAILTIVAVVEVEVEAAAAMAEWAGLVAAAEVLVSLPTQIPSLVLAAKGLGGVATPSPAVATMQHLGRVVMA
jgi:hypothetical protein